MKSVSIKLADCTVGQYVTVWSPSGSGQGGTIKEIEPGLNGLVITSPANVDFTFWMTDVARIETEVPFDADECLEYGRFGSPCSGPVEMWWAGGQRSWPRCTHHGEERLRRYEESDLERYADSDVAPDWFDPADAGERWNEDD